MMSLSEPMVAPVSDTARIGIYEVSKIKIENAGGLNYKKLAINFMDINVDAIRQECNKTSYKGTNNVPVSIYVRRLSCSNAVFFLHLLVDLRVRSHCLPYHFLNHRLFNMKYEIVHDTFGIVGRTLTGFNRLHCFSMLPIPWLIKTPSTDYYWMGCLGKSGERDELSWVTALGIYEATVIKDAIIKYLSTDVMQSMPEKLKREREMMLKQSLLRKEREELKRRLAEEKAEKERLARGVAVSDFFLGFHLEIMHRRETEFLLFPCEDEIIENTVDFHFVGYHRIYINAVVTSVKIAIDKALLKSI